MLQLAPGPIRFDVPESAKDRSIAGKFRSPINLHIGNIGLAMSTGFPVNSNAPLRTGASQKLLRSTTGTPVTLPDGQARMARGKLRLQHPVPALHPPAVEALASYGHF